MALLTARGLTVSRLGIPVLEGVDLTLDPGEAVIMRGPNGIGKTTLLRSLAGLQPVPSGTITALDETLVYSGHADGLKAPLTASENLTFWARLFRSPVDLGSVLDQLNLTHLRDRRAAELSAGQKRRLGLARLLVSGRAVWLLDEPTVSLDDASVGLFAAVVGRHLAGGGAVLAATHVDLGLTGVRVIELTPFRARAPGRGGKIGDFDEAFA